MMKLAAFAAALSLSLPAAAGGISSATLFQNRCAECHGKDGKTPTAKGRALGAPSLTARAHEVSEVERILAEGKGKMAPLRMKLSDEQITALADYVITRL